MQIDRGSYIVGAKVETFLDFNVGDGCYNLQIGKYCAIAENVLFMLDVLHDYKYIAMGAVEELCGDTLLDQGIERCRVQRKGQILIENDVWIGHGVTIMGGVTIHNGAVIAAESVVTKDVPPYAVVAGNPARIIKYRFEEKEIEALLRIAWWGWSSDQLKSRCEKMMLPIQDFIRCFDNKKLRSKDCVQMNPISKNVEGYVYVCIADMANNFPVFPKILKEFCYRYCTMNGQLVVYVENSEHREKNLHDVIQELMKYQDANCSVQIIDDEEVKLENVIRCGDYYVTNRCFSNLAAVELAYRYKKEVLSGVDIPIWKR